MDDMKVKLIILIVMLYSSTFLGGRAEDEKTLNISLDDISQYVPSPKLILLFQTFYHSRLKQVKFIRTLFLVLMLKACHTELL